MAHGWDWHEWSSSSFFDTTANICCKRKVCLTRALLSHGGSSCINSCTQWPFRLVLFPDSCELSSTTQLLFNQESCSICFYVMSCSRWEKQTKTNKHKNTPQYDKIKSLFFYLLCQDYFYGERYKTSTNAAYHSINSCNLSKKKRLFQNFYILKTLHWIWNKCLLLYMWLFEQR